MMGSNGYEGEEEWGGGGGGRGRQRQRGWFIMKDWRQVIKSEGGEMRVVISPRGRIIEKPMHIGFLTMEPKTLFVPQYLDSSLLIFIRQGPSLSHLSLSPLSHLSPSHLSLSHNMCLLAGEATLGVICKDEFGERKLKAGDIYWIPGGSVFYLLNTGRGQRLHVICSIDPSQSLGFETFQVLNI